MNHAKFTANNIIYTQPKKRYKKGLYITANQMKNLKSTGVTSDE